MKRIREAIAEAANRAYPEEACGFLLHDGTVVTCVNVADDPVNAFVVDPGDVALWWETGQVAALWHSHPRDAAVPSLEDNEQAREAGWPKLYLVYSVTDEDLGWYELEPATGNLCLTKMESPQ